MREMQDSGIKWIGKIPENWDIERLCYLIDGYKAGPFGSKLLMGQLVDNGEILIYTPEIIASQNTSLPSNKYLPPIREIEMKGFFVETGDIVFPIVGSLGKAMLITKVMPKGIINQRLAKFRISSDKIIYPYFMRLFGESDFYLPYIILNCRGSIIVNLTKSILHDMPVLLPPPLEQQAIADYLDSKCADIDGVSKDIEEQIETLKEYKKSVITQAVTKGLNPHAEMKDTKNIYWSRIPKNWILSDIKYLFEIVKRIAGKEGYDILSVTQNGLRIKDISNNEGQIAESYKGYQFVYPGDFVMNHMDLLTGWVDLSKLFGVTSPDYRVFRLRKPAENSARYYKYVMQCCYSCRIFYSLGQGVSNMGRWRLQTFTFNNFMVPVPSLMEQEAIANYLDAKCADIDAAVSEKQEQLDILKEYKKSLIYEYVTGKKEVPTSWQKKN